ncbi:MAG: FecR domain-containing protein [Terriglobales bacterium]
MRALRASLGVAALLALAVGLSADSNVRMVQLSLVSGAVEVRLPRQKVWAPALMGAPVTAGEWVRTLASGRAEVQLEYGSTLRLIPNSEIQLTRLSLSDKGEFRTTAAVRSGTVFFTLRKSDDRDLRVLLPAGGVAVPSGKTSFRIQAAQVKAAAGIQVYHGKVELQRQGATERLADTQPGADPWTRWSRNRDQYYASAFHEGLGRSQAAEVVNWWAASAVRMPIYTGIGLRYTGDASCPWTQINGEYKGWCWNQAQGWFRPGQSPVIHAVAAASASDVRQTNGLLASSLATTSPAVPQFAPLGMAGMNPCLNAALVNNMVWVDCYDGGVSPLGSGPYGWAGAPALVAVAPAVAGAGVARIPRRPVRPLNAPLHAVAERDVAMRRLGPPPSWRMARASYADFGGASRSLGAAGYNGGGFRSSLMPSAEGAGMARAAVHGSASVAAHAVASAPSIRH